MHHASHAAAIMHHASHAAAAAGALAGLRRRPSLSSSPYLPHPHNFSSLAVAVLPPSHIFSPQPFPFERRARGPTGPEHPPAHTAPQEAAVAASAR